MKKIIIGITAVLLVMLTTKKCLADNCGIPDWSNYRHTMEVKACRERNEFIQQLAKELIKEKIHQDNERERLNNRNLYYVPKKKKVKKEKLIPYR